MPSPAPRIFVSYSHADDAAVQRLQRDLERAGATIWIDHERLTPGMPDWEEAVRAGISQASFVVYAASPDARKSPYVRDEINLARGKGREVIPFWVAGDDWLDCAPLGWGMTQYSDGRGAAYAAGLQKLLRRLDLSTSETAPRSAFGPYPAAPPAIPPERFPARLATRDYAAYASGGVEWIVPPLCLVPAGQFRLGSDKSCDSQARDDELNRRVVDLPAFQIAYFPVTVAEYACFLNAFNTPDDQKPANWNDQLQRLDHPVVNVSWHDAYAYTVWLAMRANQPWRLPTEAEWEKAARCDPNDPLGASSERIYPWGDAFDTTRCNTSESKIGTTTSVGWYGPNDPDPRSGRQSGASPCGAEDLAGNVWEWTASERTAEYSRADLAAARDSSETRVLRGGSWGDDPQDVRASRRRGSPCHRAVDDRGFRLVLRVPGSSH